MSDIGKRVAAGVTGVAAAATMGSGVAVAAPVTVTQTINLNQLLSAGGSGLSGTFNINGLVPGGQSGAYDVLSATVTAFGFSDVNYGATTRDNYSGYQTALGGYSYQSGQYYVPQTGYYTYSYSCGWADLYTCYASSAYTYYVGPYPTYTYVYEVGQSSDYEHVDNVRDQLTLTAGGASSTGTATTFASSATTYGAYSFTSRSGDTEYYDRTRDVYTSYSGEDDAVLPLGAAALQSLASGGTLDYAVNAAAGQSKVQSVVLSVLVDVAEPASLGLLAGGLVAAHAARRRRRSAAQAEG